MSSVLRTPDAAFADLPGFPYAENYLERLSGFEGLRLHYVDEGPRDAECVFLCLHGEPSWSYLYRRMLPVFAAAGHRVVAPDLFGFGRSDKPADEGVYTFDFHRRTLLALLNRLDLKNICLVCQDWGGLLGLTLPMELPRRFTRLLVMNTMLGTGDRVLPPGFLAWRDWVRKNPDLRAGALIGRGCPHLSEAERAAYDAPFPDARFKAGARRFPQLVPDHPHSPGAEISRAARDFLSRVWDEPSFMAVGMKDPVLGPAVMAELRAMIRDCPVPFELSEAGHFVQEWGESIATRALLLFFGGKTN